MHNNSNFIPAHYHISDRPITYNELTALFKTIKHELPAHAPEPPHEFNPDASTPEGIDATSNHALHESESQVVINEILPSTQSSPTETQSQAFNNVLNSAISHISDGTRSVITHIPYTASLSVSPAQIAKDQAQDSTTSRIIKSLLTSNKPPRKFRRYKICLLYTSPSPRD